MKNFRTLLSTVESTGKRKIGDLTEENSLRTVEIQVLTYTLRSKMVCEKYDRGCQASGYSRFLICAGVGGRFRANEMASCTRWHDIPIILPWCAIFYGRIALLL